MSDFKGDHDQENTTGYSTIEEGGLKNEVAQSPTFEKVTEAAKLALHEAEEIITKVFARSKDLEMERHAKLKVELLKLAEDLVIEKGKYEDLVEAFILASEDLPTGIEDLISSKTEVIDRVSDSKEMIEQTNIDENMQAGIAIVFSALKNNKFPVGLIGSNAFVLEAGRKTSKIPDDIDAVAIIQDFPESYQQFKLLEKEGKIKDLKIIPMTNLGSEKNECYEVKGKVVYKGKLISFSVFFQNADVAKEDNGYVNIGKDETSFYLYEFEGPDGQKIQVPVANKETSELLYLKNTLNEIRLFMFEVFKISKKDFPYISPKSLNRLSNLGVLNDYDFDKIIALLEKGVNKKNKEQFEGAIALIVKLRKEFVENEHKAGEGLAKTLCGVESIEEKNCAENAVDIISKEVKQEMENIDKIYEKVEITMTGELSQKDKLKSIEESLIRMNELYKIYLTNIKKVNNHDNREFVLFIAMKALKNDFLKPVIDKLLIYKDKLTAELAT